MVIRKFGKVVISIPRIASRTCASHRADALSPSDCFALLVISLLHCVQRPSPGCTHKGYTLHWGGAVHNVDGTDAEDMTKAELVDYAKSNGISIDVHAKKDDILNIISND